MRKIWFIIFVSLVIGAFLYSYLPLIHLNQDKKSNKINPGSNPITPQAKGVLAQKSIFVPYWSDFSSQLALDDYNRVIYFGVEANQEGINKNEPGYKNLNSFVEATNKEKYLTVRMLNTNANIAILKDQSSWEKITQESLDVAKNYQFDGVVLDLEISAIPIIDLSPTVTSFVQYFYQQASGQGVKFALATYGDNFYRHRPFDLAALAKNSDEIMIMAYDFSKNYGEPGPNFPLNKSNQYPYDFQTMIADFTKFVPANKLTVIFGMYGYDWQVDEKKRPIKAAQALTLSEIKKKFIDSCQWQDCVVKRSSIASETEVNYVTSEMVDNFANMFYHMVWFEDEKSVEAKTQFLLNKSIESIAYWAYGYF